MRERKNVFCYSRKFTKSFDDENEVVTSCLIQMREKRVYNFVDIQMKGIM